MSDCFWSFIEGCCDASHCKECRQYLSVNSNEGMEKYKQYSQEVKEQLKPLEEKWKEQMNEYNVN